MLFEKGGIAPAPACFDSALCVETLEITSLIANDNSTVAGMRPSLFHLCRLVKQYPVWCLTSDISVSLFVLRNLSSVNEKTRQMMRETHDLVNSLVEYIKVSLGNNRAEDKVRQEEMELN